MCLSGQSKTLTTTNFKFHSKNWDTFATSNLESSKFDREKKKSLTNWVLTNTLGVRKRGLKQCELILPYYIEQIRYGWDHSMIIWTKFDRAGNLLKGAKNSFWLCGKRLEHYRFLQLQDGSGCVWISQINWQDIVLNALETLHKTWGFSNNVLIHSLAETIRTPLPPLATEPK